MGCGQPPYLLGCSLETPDWHPGEDYVLANVVQQLHHLNLADVFSAVQPQHED